MSTPSPLPPVPFEYTPTPFVGARLEEAVGNALGRIRSDQHWAIVGVADKNGSRAAGAVKFGNTWAVGAFVEYDWGGSLDYGVQVVISG